MQIMCSGLITIYIVGTVEIGIDSSSNKFYIHKTSAEAFTTTLYSASDEDCETKSY